MAFPGITVQFKAMEDVVSAPFSHTSCNQPPCKISTLLSRFLPLRLSLHFHLWVVPSLMVHYLHFLFSLSCSTPLKRLMPFLMPVSPSPPPSHPVIYGMQLHSFQFQSKARHHHLRAPVPAAMVTLHQVPLILLLVSVRCQSLGIILADAILQLWPVPPFLMRGTTLCGHCSVVCISVVEPALMNPFFTFSVHAVRHDFMYPLQRTWLHVSFVDSALACSKTQYAISTENPDIADEVDL